MCVKRSGWRLGQIRKGASWAAYWGDARVPVAAIATIAHAFVFFRGLCNALHAATRQHRHLAPGHRPAEAELVS
ncbi:MAG: hypothetical protein C0483_12095 [Pirellula sp.]|nr:hypothetical protein [Pirellula sp.]